MGYCGSWSRRLALRLALIALAALAVPAHAADGKLVVFAAASLTEAMTDAADAYARAGHPRPTLAFAASSALARQIENGAPAGLFVSADEPWADYLEQRKLLLPGSRVSFLANRLVLIAPADRPFRTKIGPRFPLARLLGNGKLAMADPDAVPAGRYGKAALTNLGVWTTVEARVVRGDSVRAALRFVETGAARAGIVYATDAAASSKVMVAGVFPESSHPPISYPLALVAGHATPEAKAFRAWLLTRPAGAIFARHGFRVQ
ncbi:MAG TPA: molybdate ABC transporter substrate-binding protein [Sphingomonadaceae bacterium]|nr:molybdate ABC transporter substrate-binding protein [Sphingomonadaceae bacterium]